MELREEAFLPPREVGRLLAGLLSGPTPGPPPRIIRVRGRRVLLAIPQPEVAEARRRLNRPSEELSRGGRLPSVRTVRTWGTLKKGKEWLDFSFDRRRGRASPASGLYTDRPPE